MLTFDRIVLTMLALGVWALVLSPRSIEAHHSNADHDCLIEGTAYGDVLNQNAEVYVWGKVTVACEHD